MQPRLASLTRGRTLSCRPGQWFLPHSRNVFPLVAHGPAHHCLRLRSGV